MGLDIGTNSIGWVIVNDSSKILDKINNLTMKHQSRLFCLIISLNCLVSCTVTNNLYVADPNPMGKGNEQAYFGIGTGVQAKIDSVNKTNGNINFSNKISTAPVLSIGGQFGISNRTDIRLAIHLPKIFGGLGIRAGLQHSFLDSLSMVNFAIGCDLGGVFTRDSIKFFGSKTSVNKETNGAINADFFIPISVKIKKDLLIVLTPRYSLSTFYILENQLNTVDKNFNLGYPALSLGIRNRQFYFEASSIFYNEKVYPHLGFVRFINF